MQELPLVILFFSHKLSGVKHIQKLKNQGKLVSVRCTEIGRDTLQSIDCLDTSKEIKWPMKNSAERIKL